MIVSVKVLNTYIYIVGDKGCKGKASTNATSEYTMSIMLIHHRNGFMATGNLCIKVVTGRTCYIKTIYTYYACPSLF